MKNIFSVCFAIFLPVFFFACGGEFLDSVDLNRYTKDLNEIQVPTQKQVVTEDVAYLVQYFDDKNIKQLAVSGISSMDVLTRMQALTQHKPVVYVDLVAIRSDAKKQQWSSAQAQAVLERVLQKKYTENTVFFMRDMQKARVNWTLIKNYPVVVEVSRDDLVEGRPYKFFEHSGVDLKFLSLEELNQKLAVLNHEETFDMQVQASIQKFEKKDHFLVRLLKENNFKMLSFGEMKDSRTSPDGKRFACRDDVGTECLYEFVKENDWVRIVAKTEL